MDNARAKDAYNLERFVAAQDAAGTYDRALAELRAGRKESHWMWFVFPQVAGLGRSPTAQQFGISSLDEAKAYLRHPILGARLLECARILTEARTDSAEQIFGGIDALKLRSSMTLFTRADPAQSLFSAVLDMFFGGVADNATDELLARGRMI